MDKFKELKFNLGTLKGISAKNIEEHLKLYSGYVKHANLIMEKIEELKKISNFKDFPALGADAYLTSILFRRFSFEYNGMRNHEIYFDSLSGGAKSLKENSALAKSLVETFGSVEIFIAEFKNIAMTRGIGWAVLWYDKKDKRLLASWVDEQHLGQLNGCEMILALDMWEHSYITDYQPSGKKQYIEDFFVNLNWEVIEKKLS